MAIRFYSLKDPFGEFSNFSAHPFQLDGVIWPTSEAYFQAQKFEDEAYREQIRLAPSPMKAANLGRSRSVPLRADWEEVKDDAMRRALYAKFSTHAELRELLLSTGDEELIEATTNDYYWGVGTRGDGLNKLGLLLMELRAQFQAEQLPFG
ncbi:NADAR family protein [bacterium]|nr:MAG: NADAR family protein [bacterium]